MTAFWLQKLLKSSYLVQVQTFNSHHDAGAYYYVIISINYILFQQISCDMI